jgi:replicative DNA helicase
MTDVEAAVRLTPPHSVDTERAVIGAVLLDAGTFVVSAAELKAEHFYVRAHRCIWRAMERLHGRGEAIDHTTLSEELRSAGDLEQVGGVIALSDLTDAVATVVNVENYASIVRSLAARRALIYVARKIVSNGYLEGIDTEEYLAESTAALARVDRLLERRHRSRGFGELVKELFSRLEKREPTKDFVSLGFGNIRVPRGVLTVVAGRPSNGKTVLALNAALNVSQGGGRVLWFSLENTAESLIKRAVARRSDVPLKQIVDGHIEKTNWGHIVEGCGDLARLDIVINDRSGASSQWIRQVAAVQQQKGPLGLVIVDYVQLMREPGTERGTEEISVATQGGVSLARELNVPVLWLSQIKRPDNRYKDKVPPPPTLDMLKGSGSLEECARMAVLLHYPRFYDESKEASYLWCRVAKNSEGPIGRCDLQCDMERMWIGDPGMNAVEADPSGREY